MGACSFSQFGIGYSASDAFASLQDRARAQYGDDPYSGTIATVSSCGRKKLAEFPEDALLKQDKEITHYTRDFPYRWLYDKLSKYEDELLKEADRDRCICVCLGIHGYRTIKVEERLKVARAPKRVSRFYLTMVNSPGGASRAQSTRFDTQFRNSCKLIAAKGNGETYYVTEVSKTHGRCHIADYIPIVTESRRRSKGSRPVYLYWFVGWARE